MLVAIAGLLIARIPVIPVRVFDPDEFEHAHAAWSVFRGLLPYRDFFEHHTPWYYFALSPFFRWFAVDQSFESATRFLAFGRGLSLLLTALSVGLLFLVGRVGANRRVGLLAGLFLVAQPVVIQKTLEIRSRRARASLLPGRALVAAARVAGAGRGSADAASGLVPRRRALPRGGHHVYAEDAFRSCRARSRASGCGRWPGAGERCSVGQARSCWSSWASPFRSH